LISESNLRADHDGGGDTELKIKKLNEHIKHIVNGYQQQSRLYIKILQISKQLTEVLENKSIEDVNAILAEKGQAADVIRKVDNDIQPHQEAVKEILHLRQFGIEKVQDLIHPDLRKEFNEQKALIENTMKEIIALDRKNEVALMRVLSQKNSKN